MCISICPSLVPTTSPIQLAHYCADTAEVDRIAYSPPDDGAELAAINCISAYLYIVGVRGGNLCVLSLILRQGGSVRERRRDAERCRCCVAGQGTAAGTPVHPCASPERAQYLITEIVLLGKGS